MTYLYVRRRTGKVLARFVAGDATPPSTFTRSTTATYPDAAGVTQTAGINVLRNSAFFGGARAVELEGSRTNTMFPSNDFTSANFTKTASTITPSATTGPDGVAASASKLVEDSTTNVHWVEKVGGFTATASTVQSASCFAKSAERTWLTISTLDGAGVSTTSYVNLTTGALGSVNGAHTIKVDALSNGWYRATISWNSNVGGAVNRAKFGAASADGTGSYLGDGVSGIYLYGYQIEADQPFSSSYIPTVGSTVTRGGDSYSVPFTTPPQAMTLYTKFKELGTISGASGGRVLQIGNSSNLAPRLVLSFNGTRYQILHDNNVTTVAAVAGVAPVIGDIVELRAVMNADGSVTIGQSINGAAEAVVANATTLAPAAAWSAATLWLAQINTGSPGFAAFLVPYKVAAGVQSLATMRNR